MKTMQSHGTGVPDRIGSLSEPDILASQQYYDQGTSGRQPERSLMFAVLLDAVECFQKYLFLHDEYSNRLVQRDGKLDFRKRSGMALFVHQYLRSSRN